MFILMNRRPAKNMRPLTRHEYEQWVYSERGRRQLQQERNAIAQILPDFFGRYCIQISPWGDKSLTSSAVTHSSHLLGNVAGQSWDARTSLERLPLRSQSVDVLVLAHALEMVSSPHELLREANRVLTDRGALIITGFNPWSFLNLKLRLGLAHSAFPQQSQFISVGRLKDWAELLDFDICSVRRFSGGQNKPMRSDQGIHRLLDSYVFAARKRVLPMNWVGKVKRSKPSPALVGGVAVRHSRIVERSSDTHSETVIKLIK